VLALLAYSMPARQAGEAVSHLLQSTSWPTYLGVCRPQLHLPPVEKADPQPAEAVLPRSTLSS
jgi:hypothetical protein